MTKFSKIIRRLECHLGRIKQAEVIIHGTSSIHFGPFYKPVNVISALGTIEVFWAEVRAGQKSIQTRKIIRLVLILVVFRNILLTSA